MKSINLALQWKLTNIDLKINTATVLAWVEFVITKKSRIRTKAETLIKRKLGILKDISKEFDIHVRASLVSSKANKDDLPTRMQDKDAAKEYVMCKVEDDVVKNCKRCNTRILGGHYICPGR